MNRRSFVSTVLSLPLLSWLGKTRTTPQTVAGCFVEMPGYKIVAWTKATDFFGKTIKATVTYKKTAPGDHPVKPITERVVEIPGYKLLSSTTFYGHTVTTNVTYQKESRE